MTLKVTTPEYNNIALLNRFFEEVWRQGKEETIDELYAVGGEAHGIGEQYKKGPEEFKLIHRLIWQTCTNIRIDVGDMFAAGDRVAIRATFTMTHKATGKELQFSGGGFARIQGGQIVEAWNGWDFLSILQTLGSVPEDILEKTLRETK